MKYYKLKTVAFYIFVATIMSFDLKGSKNENEGNCPCCNCWDNKEKKEIGETNEGNKEDTKDKKKEGTKEKEKEEEKKEKKDEKKDEEDKIEGEEGESGGEDEEKKIEGDEGGDEVEEEEGKKEEEINKRELNENENLYENQDNEEILAIKTYISSKLSKDEQYSISSTENCEGSAHKCKKITLSNDKNEEFILFIKEDRDPTFVFESLKAIGMSEINYVYYITNLFYHFGYLVTSKVDGDVYENGYDFDFAKLKNLNVYRFFCALLGCSDCEPFYRIDNVYIKNNEVFLLDYSLNSFSKIKSIEEFLDKLTYNTENIPSAINRCNRDYLKKYKDEEEQAFWVSVDMIHYGSFCKENEYFATNLNNNAPIACSTCLLTYLKLYCSRELKIEDKEIFGYLKDNISNNDFINGFKEYCESEKKQDTYNNVEGLLEKLDKENLEDFFNKELEWGRKIIKYTKTKMGKYSQRENKLKESYNFSNLEKQQIGEKLNQLIEFYQTNEGKELIEKYQNNFKIVVSYLNNLINVPDFISYMGNDILNIIKDFIQNNSTYIIEEKSSCNVF